MACNCTLCVKEYVGDGSRFLASAFDNSKAVLRGETARKNLKIVRVAKGAPDAMIAAIVLAHQGAEIPGSADLDSDTYVMGPRDHTYELIRVLLKKIGETGSLNRGDLTDHVYEASVNLWRAVGRTTVEEVRNVVNFIVGAIERR